MSSEETLNELRKILEKIYERTEIGKLPTYILVGKKEFERIKHECDWEFDEEDSFFLFGLESLVVHKRSFLDVI